MIILDAHVHYHKNFDENVFYDSIKLNIQSLAKKNNYNSFQSLICLTESSGVNYFSELITKIDETRFLKGWKIAPSKNKNSLIVTDKSNFKIFIIAGRQIVTKENLEVLALGMIEEFEGKLPMKLVIEFVINQGLIPIIPWGFGKWTGARKKIVEEIISENVLYPLFLGDNGNRPNLMDIPSIITSGYKKKIYNLQGSDPLPLKNEDQRPGSFGIVIDKELDVENPFDSLYKILSDKNIDIRIFGQLESPLRFVKNQLAMQIVKRFRT